MTSDPGKQKANDKLERDLEEFRAVLSGPGCPEPPDLLNQAVLNAARRELDASGKRWLRRFPIRWMGAFATASVIILALGLIVQQEQESPSLPGMEEDRLKLKSEAPLVESKDAVEKQLMSKSIDRDDSAVQRAAPMAAAPAKTAEFSAEEVADDNALLEQGDAMEGARSPEEWIDLMLELKSSNQLNRLSTELEAFRSVYPDHPLPNELRD
jgi:hypothetical protein